MLVDMDDFEVDLGKLSESFSKLFKDMGIDETDDQKVYNTITIFIASLFADGLFNEYGDDPEQLEANLKHTCAKIAADMQEKIRVFFDVIGAE